jgi:hypothetical protein
MTVRFIRLRASVGALAGGAERCRASIAGTSSTGVTGSAIVNGLARLGEWALWVWGPLVDVRCSVRLACWPGRRPGAER